MKKDFDNALWLNKETNELVLIARGSGSNLGEDDIGLIANPSKLFGIDGADVWARWQDCGRDIGRFVAEIAAKCELSVPVVFDRWSEWLEANTAEYDTETYSMVFGLDTMANGEEIRRLLDNVEGHHIDIWPTGFSIDDIVVDEDEAMLDGGLQTTFAAGTPSVCDPAQLVESLRMCGAGDDCTGFELVAAC